MLSPPLLSNQSLAGAASLVIPALFLVTAWSSYSTAVKAALRYGETLALVFDLHRFLLYESLHQPVPHENDEERERNAKLSRAMESGRHADPFILPAAAKKADSAT